MILPNSNNSKYVKTIIGVFILFTIISPFIKKVNGKNNPINLNNYIETSSNSIINENAKLNNNNSSNNSANPNNNLIKQMYEENLKIDIKTKVSQKGYIVGNINVEILDNEEYTLNSIKLQILGMSEKQNNNMPQTTTIIENVSNILINVSKDKSSTNQKEKSAISEGEKRKIIQYLSSVYEVREKNINVY